MTAQIPVHKGHWLLGSAREIFPHVHRFVADTAQQHGGIARFRIVNRTVNTTVRPEDAQHILLDNVDSYIKSYHYRTAVVINGNGLLNSDGNHWRRQRRGVQPAFKRSLLKPTVKIAADECDATLRHWNERKTSAGVIDVMPEMRGIALRSMTRALLGYDLDAEQAERFERDATEGLIAIGRRNNSVAIPLWLPTPENRTLKRVRRTLDDILRIEVSRRRAAIRAGEKTSGGILDHYVSNEGMSERDAYSETTTLFTAGFETSATALNWVLAMLASHPDVAEACYEEVDHVIGAQQVTDADIPKLSTITAVYEETLRLYPPVTHIGRQSLADDDLSGYRLPKGSTIVISIFGIQRAEKYWDKPDIFDPSRFSPQRRQEIPMQAYMPFGMGRRTCIGNHFAYQEQIAVIATILQKFRVEMPKETKIEEVMRVTLQPGVRLPLRVTPRKNT